MLFLPLYFCPLVSTQNCPDIIKHDFSPVAPPSFIPPHSPSLPFIPSLKQMAFYAGHNQDYSASGWQALPTCAQPNHNLMNTLGTVCSKLLPVGARATGNPPCHHTMPLPRHITSFAIVSLPTRLSRLAAVLRPSTLTPNQIKILILKLSTFQHSSNRPRVQRQAYTLHVGRCGLTANVFMCWS